MRPHFTKEMVEFFTQGECYALALDLHRRTGWPIVGVCARKFRFPSERASKQDRSYWTYGMCHFLVRTPEGLLLDVTGARDDAAILKHWVARELVQHAEQVEVAHELRQHWFPATALVDVENPAFIRKRARYVARRVLTLYSQQPADFVPLTWWTCDLASIGMGDGITSDTISSYRRLQDAGIVPKRVRAQYLIREVAGVS